MKNIAITILIVLLALIMGLYFISFQVSEVESVMVTTFGKPTRQIISPGWYFKWPVPIQRVYKFDSRLRVFEADMTETTTKGAVPIIVNTYIVWRIAQPLEFFNALGTIKNARGKLLSQISDTQNKVIGRHYFAEFVNSDPEKIKFDQIQKEMFDELSLALGTDYGIQIADLGIRQLKASEKVSEDVFDRIRADRNRRTEATMAQGLAEATRIRTDADSKKTELLAVAEARAKAIQGQGDAEAAKYYKMLEEDTELAMFLRDIEALKKILEKRSTIILSADAEPFKLIKEMPDLKPKK